jgi:type IV pilus assembly protein PilM
MAAGAAGAGSADSGGSTEVTGPEGPGWVIEIKGHHFYNADITTWGGTHVRDTFLKNLREQTVELPTGPGQPPTRFTMKELGIDFAVLTVDPPIDHTNRIPNPFYEGTPGATGAYPGGTEGMMPGMMPGMGMTPGGMGAPGMGMPGGAAKPEKKENEKEEPKEPPFFIAPKYTFVLQFCWQQKLLTERLRERMEAQMQQQSEPTEPTGEPEESGQPEQPPAATPGNKVAAANTGG